ncbi:MAG: hypothetical protein Q8S73_24465 [Deltaproteobacteria bacterium]|nr:hypothetical protein [Myxococcales bacterium]MDP3217288.1 hypothetical protein [Deltaproteobacteria bacterium]
MSTTLNDRDAAAEVLSFVAQRDELGQTIALSVAGWYRVRPVGGIARFAPNPDASAGMPLDEAVAAIAAEARALLARDESSQEAEQTGEQQGGAGGVHGANISPAVTAREVP